jgi:hypothetical protein
MAKTIPQKGEDTIEVYILKVSFRDHPEIFRTIKTATDNTLVELHEAIQASIGWANDHMYAFYMSGRPGDQETEYYPDYPEADWPAHPGKDAKVVLVGSQALGLRKGSKFLYFFDFGDSHCFDVEVQDIIEDDPLSRKDLPKVIARKGKAPKQY